MFELRMVWRGAAVMIDMQLNVRVGARRAHRDIEPNTYIHASMLLGQARYIDVRLMGLRSAKSESSQSTSSMFTIDLYPSGQASNRLSHR